uniref:Hcy-binding domain-containing protein n=1 Tax=Timema shepardi TaxID=629360 RepID=A0A7R9FXQ3_TIMSH|nr:unnamed protein product [Timema shepardi]
MLGSDDEKSYACCLQAGLWPETLNLCLAEKRPLVVGSVGPYGASLHDYSEYTGDYVEQVTKHHIADWHRSRIQALVEAGVDILAFETIPAQKEGEVLMELLKEFPHQKAWLSFSCKDEHHTSHGEKLDEAAQACWDLNPNQLVAVGVNCLNPKFVTSLLSGINRGRVDDPIPLVVYPNSGENYDLVKGWVDGDKCEPVETYIPEWLDMGVTYVGGCCRTYAHDVKRIKEVVQKWSSTVELNTTSALANYATEAAFKVVTFGNSTRNREGGKQFCSTVSGKTLHMTDSLSNK